MVFIEAKTINTFPLTFYGLPAGLIIKLTETENRRKSNFNPRPQGIHIRMKIPDREATLSIYVTFGEK